MHIDSPLCASKRICEEYYIGLQALCLVQIHEPDDICSSRLQRQGFNLARSLSVSLKHVRCIGQTASSFKDLPHSIDRVNDIPRVHPTGAGSRERDVPAVLKDSIKRSGSREHARPSVIARQSS
jgi:hypothetical protein